MKLCSYLVVDTGGFIKHPNPGSLAEVEVVTLREVVKEMRDKPTKQRVLNATAYQIQYKEPHTEEIQFVTDFSKKTGDYSSLSAVDIKVMALALRLEKEQMGGDSHLNKEPKMKPTINFYKPGEDREKVEAENAKKLPPLPGFYNGEEEDEEVESEEIINKVEDLEIAPIQNEQENSEEKGEDNEEDSEEEGEDNEEDSDENEEGEGDDDEDDDDEGWITPSNLKEKNRQINGIEPEETEHVKVACMTTDFAMQNVLKQIGLHVVSTSGLLIRETKTWVLRCYACFKITSLMDKKFCPKCGNSTLKRVAVTLDADGSTRIHISTRRQLTGRGKKFSLPKPQGGKYAVNPILCEDQHLPQQRISRLARKKTDAMGEDYVAGNAPFVLRDVTSRSAQLGVQGKGAKANLYWMKRNPNEVKSKTGNRKKKRA